VVVRGHDPPILSRGAAAELPETRTFGRCPAITGHAANCCVAIEVLRPHRSAAWRSQCCVAIEVLRPRVLGGSGMATGGEALSSP